MSEVPLLARPAVRYPALVGLWAVAVGVFWILLVQAFLLALNPFCHAQLPKVHRVEVKAMDPNPDSQLTDFVTVKRGEDEDRVLSFSKAEAAELKHEDTAWILEAWYLDGLRPEAYRLTPARLLLEYPALLLLPVGFGLWRLRKARQVAAAAPPPPIRRTFTDDFHLRAQRFATSAEGKETANDAKARERKDGDSQEPGA